MIGLGTVSFLVQISFESPGVEHSIKARLIADLKIAKDLSRNALLGVGHLAMKMGLELQELIATEKDLEAGHVPRDLFQD